MDIQGTRSRSRFDDEPFSELVVRGWWKVTGSAPIDIELDERASWAYLSLVTYPYVDESSGGQQPMRLEIDGMEVRVSEYVRGAMPDLDYDQWEVDHGEASVWLDADHGFGVAVINQTHQLENEDGEGGHFEFSIVSTLVATGTDAVSDLPDHN